MIPKWNIPQCLFFNYQPFHLITTLKALARVSHAYIINFAVFRGKINNSDFTLSENLFLKTITFTKIYLEKKSKKGKTGMWSHEDKKASVNN